ncbi:MAG: response regulator [Phototrophicaceae bacterium]
MNTSKILYIDDNPTNLEFIRRLLQRKGYDCQTLSNSVERLSVAKTFQPDLILLDIQIPELNGFEVLKQLRQDPIIEDVPVLALTANAMSGDKRLCMEAGFDDYLTKPIFREELFRKVTQHLKQATTT